MPSAQRVVHPIDAASSEVEDCWALYRKNSGTLGRFPRGAFDDMVADGHILVAYTGRNLDGYVSFRVNKRSDVVVIVHLCVRQDLRGRGVASSLLEELFRQMANRAAVRLSCREDYDDANRLWPRHGFICSSEKTGRARDGTKLLLWTRQLSGQTPPLLAMLQDAQRQGVKTVAVDANVFFDFDSDEDRADESKALLADWLATDVTIAVTAEMHNELSRQRDPDLRRQHRVRMTSFTLLEATPDEVAARLAELGTVLPEPVTESDASDRRQLAHAAAEGADYFVTRDSVLLDHAQAVRALLGIEVVRPSELIVQLHGEGAREQYVPARLAGTHVQRNAPRLEEEFLPFQRYGRGEKKASWVARFRPVLAEPQHYTSWIFVPPGDDATVLVSVRTDELDVLTIHVLRARNHPLSSTLLRRVLSEVLVRAQEGGQRLVVCADAGSPMVDAALADLGFEDSERGPCRATVREVVARDDVKDALEDLPVPGAWTDAAVGATELEARFWPLKVVGADVPTYLVPIKPHWASELFDDRLAEGQLFGAKPELALALENVYYSASKVDIPEGSRILWYVSGDKQTTVREIRACSICQGTVRGTASDLFREFSRLGIYRWRDVIRAARQDHDKVLRAYRFALTERFPRPVSWEDLQQILIDRQGRGNPCAGPVCVSEDVFQDVYCQGTQLVSEHAAVVVSIKPEYVRAIAAGTKTIELRRRFPSVAAGMWLVVYATLPVGAVVGMARIEKVDRRPPEALWDRYEGEVGIDRAGFDAYFDGCETGLAIELKGYRSFSPVSIDAMQKALPGFRPPQSFRYLNADALTRLKQIAQPSGGGAAPATSTG